MKFKFILIILLAGVLLASFSMITHAQSKDYVSQETLMQNDIRDLIRADSAIVYARDAKTEYQEKMELANRRHAIDAYNLDAIGYPAAGFLPPLIHYVPNPTNDKIFNEFVMYGQYV